MIPVLAQTMMQIAGLLLVGLVIAMLAVSAASMIRRHRHAAQQRQLWLELMQEQVRATRARRRSEVGVAHAWAGFRKFTVDRKVDEGGGICSFYLVPHDRKQIPLFRPGQYLTFQLAIAGLAKPIIRCYSLSDGPGLDYYRVTIKKLPPPPDHVDAPAGLASNFFHDHVAEGDILDVKTPGGRFCLDLASETPVVLIGGGVGVTPMLSMLNTMAASGSKRETWFFYGVRNRTEHIMADHLRHVTQEHANVRLHLCYSSPGSSDVLGRDYHHAERVSVDLLRRLLPSNNYRFYVCGPPPMMDALVHGLADWGVPKGDIHFEAFGPASVKKAAPIEKLSSPGAIEVVFGRSGQSCQWTPAAGTLLELAETNGVRIECGCRAGNCGTCITAIRSGEVRYTQEPGAQPEEGSCLTCIAVPQGRLVLDA